MIWEKGDRIFLAEGQYDWMISHAQQPTVDECEGGRLRIYFGTRDRHNRTVTAFAEVDAREPARLLYLHDQPALGLGPLGAFDDSGAMPSCVVNQEGARYLYYTGWNVCATVPYRNAIGLAVSEDGGKSFRRIFRGPVLDRTETEGYFCAAPWVRVENGRWRMWYLSCVRWEKIDGRPEPFYHIKYAESADGIHWRREGRVCIDFKNEQEAGIVRPTLLQDENGYRMWFSCRSGHGYRSNREQAYRIGYAESADGLSWQRQDEKAGISPSAAGWDSQMLAYPCVHRCGNSIYLFYNGNGFGRSGFGYARARKEEMES